MPLGGVILSATIDTASSGDNTIVAAVSGEKISVFRLWLWSNGTVSVTIKDGAGTNLAGAMALVAQSDPKWPLSEEPWFTTTAGNAFILNLSDAIQVSGRVYYVQR